MEIQDQEKIKKNLKLTLYNKKIKVNNFGGNKIQ